MFAWMVVIWLVCIAMLLACSDRVRLKAGLGILMGILIVAPFVVLWVLLTGLSLLMALPFARKRRLEIKYLDTRMLPLGGGWKLATAEDVHGMPICALISPAGKYWTSEDGGHDV